MIALDKIRIDGGTQSRVELNQDVVNEYATLYRDGVQMPPVIVFFDGSTYWLVDGFHRFFGAKQAGLESIYEERIPGTQRQAVLYSLSANAKHGLRRSNADKRRAVETLLNDPEWSKWSSNEVAKRCGVSHTFVDDVRKAILQPLQDTPTLPVVRTVTRNGTTYEQNTGNIGKQPASNIIGADQAPQPAQSNPITVAMPAIIEGIGETVPDEPARSEIEELKDFVQEQGQSLKETLAENESMARVFDADDRVAAAMAEVKRFSALNAVLESRNTGLTNELAVAINAVKSWKRRAERAEAALAALKGGA